MQEPGASGTDGGTRKTDLDVRAHHKKVQIRWAVASDPATPPETLEAMATDPSRTVRRALAARTDAPGKVLRALAQDPDLKTRQTLVKNPSCPSDVLINMVEDPHWSVRWSVPEHPAADAEARRAICRSADEVLRGLLAEQDGLDGKTNSVLAADPSPNVRARLAAHTDAPDILATLITDATPKVRAGATENPITTTNQHRLLSNDKSATVRKAAVTSEKLPHDELHRLAHDRSVDVRWYLALWPTTPETVLRVLSEDPHPDVVAQAQARLGENT
ncbi:hypothetical protein AB0G15_06155 [Streptosporangium sp. NPDC023825]|uniref:hypothetical protein n=1 Tax=Streptosporangium sp. NPDC023825 TaxID=3154909 RepID=UPI00343F8F61